MKKIAVVASLLASLLMLGACAPRSIPTSALNAQKAVDEMTFVKNEKAGLCFGIISSSSISGHGASTSMSATLVPCDKVQDQLPRKLDSGLSTK